MIIKQTRWNFEICIRKPKFAYRYRESVILAIRPVKRVRISEQLNRIGSQPFGHYSLVIRHVKIFYWRFQSFFYHFLRQMFQRFLSNNCRILLSLVFSLAKVLKDWNFIKWVSCKWPDLAANDLTVLQVVIYFEFLEKFCSLHLMNS